MATAAERQRLSRRRKKLRKMVCRQVEVTEQEVELLRRRGYAARQGDQVAVSEAVSALLGDLVPRDEGVKKIEAFGRWLPKSRGAHRRRLVRVEPCACVRCALFARESRSGSLGWAAPWKSSPANTD